jgi:hypothetical protein
MKKRMVKLSSIREWEGLSACLAALAQNPRGITLKSKSTSTITSTNPKPPLGP